MAHTFEFLLLAIIGNIAVATGSTVLSDEFVEKNENFALNFYTQLINDPNNKDKSIIYSPFSIQTAGGLLYAGANGVTADQMYKGFNLVSKDSSIVGKTFKKILDYANSPLMKILNKIYLMSGNTIAPEFHEIGINNFNSEINNINFAKNIEAAGEISKWVEDNTAGKIKDFVKENDVDADTKMFIVNVIHFKGEWKTKFNKENTKESQFWQTPEKSIQVDMMYRTGEYNFGRYPDLSAFGVEIPFNGNISLFVLLPKNKQIGIEELETKIQTANLNKMFSEVSEMKMILSLPKFKIETSVDMKPILENMDMKDMFGAKADFSKLLSTGEPLEVSKAIHKAVIEVTEEGAEAAAATGFGITFRTGPFQMNLNRPFLYFVKGRNNEVYFMGRYMGN